MRLRANLLKELVGASGFEPPTSWSRRLVARRIKKLDGTRRIATKRYLVQRPLWVTRGTQQLVAPSRVRWWAQNWAQSPGVARVVRDGTQRLRGRPYQPARYFQFFFKFSGYGCLVR